MASIIKCSNLVLSYKDNKYRGYKRILVFLKPRELIKGLIKRLVKGKELIKG